MARYLLSELAQRTQSQLVGDPNYAIEGVEQLSAATPKEAAFFENPKYAKQIAESQAGVIVVHPNVSLCENKNFLLNENPSFAFQILIELFIEDAPSAYQGIHPTAIIHPTVSLGKDISIGPYAVIDQGVVMGNRCRIESGCFIGAKTQIGDDCYLHPKVIIKENCHIGNRVILQAGVVIGSPGFGYHTDKAGKHHALKQLGKVVIEDDVEVGANTTIDRARFTTTLIRRGTKIDNLVQIGHGVEIGEDNLIVAQVGIAGSTKTGRNVVIGGQVGIVGHIEIRDRVILAARSGVTKSIEEPGIYSGAPAMPIKEGYILFAQLKGLAKAKIPQQLEALEKRLAALEKSEAEV